MSKVLGSSGEGMTFTVAEIVYAATDASSSTFVVGWGRWANRVQKLLDRCNVGRAIVSFLINRFNICSGV